MGENQRCADDRRFAEAKTTKSLLQIGLSLKQDLILKPNWAFIVGMLAGLFITILFLVGLLAYLAKKSWKAS